MDILHVVALKPAGPQVVPAWPAVFLRECGDWVAGTVSPFVIPRRKLLDQLLIFAQPFVCFTLRQADSWQLGAGNGGHLLADYHHVFSQPGSTQPEADLLHTLAALGLPIDPEALQRFFAASQPPTEPSWPAGDLPRFLELVGLTGIFPAGIPDADKGKSQARRVKVQAQGCGELVAAKIREMAPAPLAAPVLLAWEELHQLFRLAWFADDDSSPVIELRGPGTEKITWPAGGTSHQHLFPGGFRIGFDYYASPFSIFAWLEEAIQFLRPLLQSGWEAELMTAPVSAREAGYTDEPGPENPGGYQRYQGRLNSQGQLEILAAGPSLPAGALAEALHLSAWVDRGGPLEMPDEQTAIAFARQLKSSGDVNKALLERQGAAILIPDTYERAFAARHRFIETCHGPWDLSRSRQLQEEIDEAGASLHSAGNLLLQAIQKPHTGEVVYQGLSGQFLAGNASGLDSSVGQTLATLTAEMEDTGFFPLGDIVWEPGGDVFVRLFGHSGGAAYAVVMLSLMGIVGEFQTTFADQGKVLTSTMADLTHDQPRQVFKYSYPGLSMQQLWKKHRKHILGYQEEHGAEPLTAVSDFQIFLRHLDQELARQFAKP